VLVLCAFAFSLSPWLANFFTGWMYGTVELNVLWGSLLLQKERTKRAYALFWQQVYFGKDAIDN
jgi:hypothetical protein